MTDVEGPTTSTNKDVLSLSGERAPKTKILVPSKRVDSSISDLSISDITKLKENGDVENKKIGQITSGIYSPRIKKNIGLSMILKDYWEVGENIIVQMLNGEKRSGTITTLPFPQ